MRKIIFILAMFMFSFTAVAHAGEIIFESSVVGQTTYYPGDKIQMSWVANGLPKELKLNLELESPQTGHLYPLKQHLKQKGQYVWRIPKKTAPAEDYRLSMSTLDKGPSVISLNSPTFKVSNKLLKSEQIKDFKIKLEQKKKKINITMSRYKGSTMALNIVCDQNKVVLKDSAGGIVECNSWQGRWSGKKIPVTLWYEKLTEDAKVYFTLDLYADDSKLLQRLFSDPVVLQ